MTQLIVFRAIQGVGGGAIGPMVLTLMSDICTPQERPRIQSYSGTIWGVSAVAGPLVGAVLLEQLPACEILHADKGYDANAIRAQVEESGAMPNIPPKANRKWKNCFSPFLYRNRNAIERMFCRLKDFRRVATRYDRNAVNFLAAVCIAAAVSYWL